MECINFEDFRFQCEEQGIYSLYDVIIEWMNCMNITYDVYCELTKRYANLPDGRKELYSLPFAVHDM
jgi:hypothetical protein